MTKIVVYDIILIEGNIGVFEMSIARYSLKKLVPGALVVGLLIASPVTYATNKLPNGTANNKINQANICSLKIGVLIDRSNSIRNDSEQNPQYIRNAVGEIASGLKGTDSQMAVWSFGTKATGYQGKNIIIGNNGTDKSKTAASIKLSDYPGVGFTSLKDQSGVTAIKNTVNLIPFSTDKLSAQNSSLAEREVGWTNWQAALIESNASGSKPAQADIVFMITDGTPTLPRDFHAEPTTDPLDKNQIARQAVVSGVQAADSVKKSAAKTRIVAIGVGDVMKTDDGIDNLKRISGGLSNAKQNDDYYLVNGFSDLGSELNKAIKQACDEKPITKPTPQPKPTPAPEQPAELPKTGMTETILSGATGLGALTYVALLYRRSRSL